MVLLETITLDPGLMAGGLFALAAAIIIVFIVIGILLWIYVSMAYMAIAKKAKYKYPGIAWIPGIGPLIITSSVAKMHWWPILLLLGVWIPILGWILAIVLTVFATIWLWKTFEKIKKPGWWAILCLIPVVNYVVLGIAAWSK